MMKKNILLLFILFLLVCACKETPTGIQSGHMPAGVDTICNTITYDIVVKNPDTADMWMADCLKDLKREELIDLIFTGIYDKKVSAYDIFEDNKISPGQLRKMEEEGTIIRDQIGKFQFVEAWYFDKTNMTMTKRVKEIRLGTEAFSSDGFLVGYEPLFKIILN